MGLRLESVGYPPGWSAQRFIEASLGKLSRMRASLPDHVALEVDGGIHEATAGPCVEAGANLLVAGSALFASGEPAEAYRGLASSVGVE